MSCINTFNEHLTIWIFVKVLQVSDWGFTMVVYEKIYLEAYTNNQYICLKNNTAELYFC